LRHTVALVVKFSKGVRCATASPISSFAIPFQALGVVLGDSQAAVVSVTEAILSAGVTLFSGSAVPTNRFNVIPCQPPVPPEGVLKTEAKLGVGVSIFSKPTSF
jgi:hypothetical protein